MERFLTFQRRVAFPDTDAMGVVHHSHYLDFCDEARHYWLPDPALLTVHSYRVAHLKPAFFDDLLLIKGQWRTVDDLIHIQYAIFKGDDKITEAESFHRASVAGEPPTPWFDGWLQSKPI